MYYIKICPNCYQMKIIFMIHIFIKNIYFLALGVLCIEERRPCDRRNHCLDGSDESHEEHLGCNFYSNDTKPEPCSLTVRGERHVRCSAEKKLTICVPDLCCIDCGIKGWCRSRHYDNEMELGNILL